MGILDLFKPAPYKEETTDENLVKSRYKYWRLRVFIGMYVGYIFYYFSRKSFTFAMPALMKDLGFDKSDLGIMGSILSITYGISKFLGGILADKTNPRYLMGIGLILTGVFNIFFGFSSSLIFFGLFWGLNGWFQGWGWPPCGRLLVNWYSQTERGSWWGVWNTSHSVGGALIPLLAAFCAQYWGWRYAMYVPGVMCIGIGFFVLNRLRDTPQSLGLPSIEKFRNDYPDAKQKVDQELSFKEILLKYVLKNKYIWLLAISYFFVYIIRTAINDWTVLFLVENKGYSLTMAGACVFWFEIGGIFGSLAAGFASDRIFKGRRGPINILFSLAVIFAIGGLWSSPPGMFMLDFGLMFLIGFLIFGPQMLIGMAAAELSHKKAASTANGFVGWVSYLGATVAGYPLGKMTQELGWYGFFVALGVCAFIAGTVLLPLWSVKTNPKYLKASPEEKPELPSGEETT